MLTINSFLSTIVRRETPTSFWDQVSCTSNVTFTSRFYFSANGIKSQRFHCKSFSSRATRLASHPFLRSEDRRTVQLNAFCQIFQVVFNHVTHSYFHDLKILNSGQRNIAFSVQKTRGSPDIVNEFGDMRRSKESSEGNVFGYVDFESLTWRGRMRQLHNG